MLAEKIFATFPLFTVTAENAKIDLKRMPVILICKSTWRYTLNVNRKISIRQKEVSTAFSRTFVGIELFQQDQGSIRML